MRTALTLEAKEDARRFFDQERVKLLQEIAELKSSKKQTDEALSNMIQADKMKAGDLRVEHQQHQEQISKIKWDSERDIRRLVRTPLYNINQAHYSCHIGCPYSVVFFPVTSAVFLLQVNCVKELVL